MNTQQESLTAIPLFSAPIYMIEKPEFLSTARKVAKKFIAKRKKDVDLNPLYPVYMTESLNYEPEMLELSNYIAQTAWNILLDQGYAMDSFNTYFTEMWCQEHHTMSLMERHIHGNGSVISGFYFLDCPKDGSRVLFHDPRDAKVISGLPENNMSALTAASNTANFEAKEGMIMLTNAWLPHSFSKNESKHPVRFIHFNISVSQVPQKSCHKDTAEVI